MPSGRIGKRRVVLAIVAGIAGAIATAANYVEGFVPRLVAIAMVGVVVALVAYHAEAVASANPGWFLNPPSPDQRPLTVADTWVA